MRTIKFRGFHANETGETVIKLNGKEIKGTWYYGDLSTDGGYYIQEHAVLPETVGQYINKNDLNGQELYEGDAVRNTYSETIFIVSYTSKASFVAKRDIFFLDLSYPESSREVIGNIYENPELLEVEK